MFFSATVRVNWLNGYRNRMHNKRLQLDNLQAVRFAVSLSLHFTAKRTAYKLRLKRALGVLHTVSEQLGVSQKWTR